MSRPPDGLQIQLTATAESVYTRCSEEADQCISNGDARNPKVKFFRTLDDALSNGIPSDPFNQKIALSGSLSSIFRFSQDNLRVCYLGHGEQRRIIVLYICQSSAEENESYARFTYMVMSGKFDAAFASLGLRLPDRQGLLPNPRVN
jgi:hypothetical protein